VGDDDSGPEDALDDLDLECVTAVRLKEPYAVEEPTASKLF